MGLHRKQLYLLFVAFLAFLASPEGFASGGWSGNGGNTAMDRDNIWFLGPEAIPYCVITEHPNFTAAAIEIMIEKATQKWLFFFRRYQMEQFNYGSDHYHGFPDRVSRSASLNWQKSTDCVEVIKACHPKHTDPQKCYEKLQSQVLFLIGPKNTIVENYLNTNGAASGVALRTEYNHQSYRSGGIVWVGQQKRNGWDELGHMILHEMGHVLGMKHDSCWVMNTNISKILDSWNGLGQLNSIEAQNWPYSFLTGDHLIFTDARVKFENLPQGSYPNFMLESSGLLEILGFDKAYGFQVRAKILNDTGNGITLRLQFEETNTAKTHTLEGLLQSQDFDSDLLPGVYTDWVYAGESTDSKVRGTEKNFYGWKSTNLIGLLDWNHQKVSIVLRRDRGLHLNLYFPNANNWFTLNTVQFSD
jgi:hypothetical protein